MPVEEQRKGNGVRPQAQQSGLRMTIAFSFSDQSSLSGRPLLLLPIGLLHFLPSIHSHSGAIQTCPSRGTITPKSTTSSSRCGALDSSIPEALWYVSMCFIHPYNSGRAPTRLANMWHFFLFSSNEPSSWTTRPSPYKKSPKGACAHALEKLYVNKYRSSTPKHSILTLFQRTNV